MLPLSLEGQLANQLSPALRGAGFFFALAPKRRFPQSFRDYLISRAADWSRFSSNRRAGGFFYAPPPQIHRPLYGGRCQLICCFSFSVVFRIRGRLLL
jgi:hypothetical protein